MCKTTAIVPIRSGSKRIIDKNITEFLGKHLFWWVCNALENSDIDKFIVSSNSQEYLDRVIDEGFTKVIPHLRSEKTSQDTSSTEDVMYEVITDLDLEGNILLTQATSPWVTSSDINNIIQQFTTGLYSSILSVVKNDKFLWKQNLDNYIIEGNYDSQNRPRSQDFNDVYYIENGGMYINSIINFMQKYNRITGPLIGYYTMPYWTVHEIDTIEDLKILEQIMRIKDYGY